MDAALLTTKEFWEDASPVTAGDRELPGHVLFETSGSSGAPKQIALSKEALLVSAAAVNNHLGVSADSCWGLALPTHHVGGFGVAARVFQAGCRIADLRGKWNPQAFRDRLAKTGVTHGSLVPTQVHDLAREKLEAPRGLVAIVVGGGHLDTATGQAARDLGWPVLASYGMTEAGSQIATQRPEELGGIYQPSPIPLLPIWRTRLAADGRLRIAGRALFSGHVADGHYFPREDDWHTTSDLAELTDGGLVPLGRADALVKVLGELVDPEAIERDLIAASAGRLAAGTFAVVALPDERAEHRLVAVFSPTVDPDLIHQTIVCHNHTAPGFQRLGPPVFLETIPLGPLGKVQRSKLRELFG